MSAPSHSWHRGCALARRCAAVGPRGRRRGVGSGRREARGRWGGSGCRRRWSALCILRGLSSPSRRRRLREPNVLKATRCEFGATGVASMARILTRVETRTRLLSTVDIVTTIPSISRDAARIITAPSAIPSLYLVSFSEPAAPAVPRARASAAATATVERADEALLYARLRLPVVVSDVKPKNRSETV